MSRPAQPDRMTKARRKALRCDRRPPFECIALLLQGGGALGAYQAGVYEALAEANLQPDWVAGISIGGINSALIAGNPPETRLEKLREFWQTVTARPLWDGAEALAFCTGMPLERLMRGTGSAAAPLGAMSLAPTSTKPLPAQSAGNGHAAQERDWLSAMWESFGLKPPATQPPDLASLMLRGDVARSAANWISANMALVRGAPGFFAPRVPVPWLQPAGSIEATSYYETTVLKATLERLVDFDRINAGGMRFAVGAVNVTSGNFVYFDNTTHTITPAHVMASGALPPGFPPVEIDGEYYWDGGLVSNTPLQWVLESEPRCDTLAFQVDLWSARGDVPRNIPEVMTRQKEIQYSSRTRANSDRFRQIQRVRGALAQLLPKLPEELRSGPAFDLLNSLADRKVYNLIQLIYRSKQYEGDSKDYEFSRLSMDDHWRAGYHDTVRTLRHPEVLERPTNRAGVLTFDLAHDGRE